ncbi:competence/damage-inducible protein A [Sediminibacillus dalangtanensis]|uniref:Putative competence-damage inducible protein n=1 Tax=Sediminibacillus dalangtanensis TaxID=2729421 RepID=A0ABX7VVK2_9BACI|nr:competence/damage-inducible protein A [Sediminibacillus dalangtanensis]QTM99478.1 competence/damage-inducible protein A [Sediminibacillus dalangtanensis]
MTKKQVSAEIVAVGTELLLGQISNTNGQWLSKRLADYGVNVYHHSVVGDNLERVKQVFTTAAKRSDIVLVTGGLGPTEDDMTRDAFQEIYGVDVVTDEPSLQKIISYFKNNHRKMTPNNRKQALIFNGSQALPNHVGMAPGMAMETEDVTWIFMPGVPREMKQIAEEYAFPYIKEKYQLDRVIQSRMLRFVGIGESQLEHQLQSLIAVQTNPTIAPLALEGEVAVRLTASASTSQAAERLIREAEKQILELVGDFFYGYDEENLEAKTVEMLAEGKLKIAAAESLTGGMFTSKLVSVPGASQIVAGSVVCYSPEVKQSVVKVLPETIDRFGTVSKQCAEEMAENILSSFHADIGISFTGVAGPGESEGNPPGTVFIGISQQQKETKVYQFQFNGNRETIRARTVKKGLELLYRLNNNMI